jgi:hypothetical protein
VRRETGKEQAVGVRCGEGIAIHIDPEPCTGTREGKGEASAGERAGQPLSRESEIARGADAVTHAEGSMGGRVIASVRLTPRGLRPWHARTLLVREPGDLWLDRLKRNGKEAVRIGKARSRSR